MKKNSGVVLSVFLKSVSQKRWMKVCFGACIVCFTILALLPVAMKYSLQKWLVQNGAESAEIGHFWINPFLGKVTIEDVAIRKDDKDMLTNSRIVLDVSLLSLFSRDFHVERAVYNNFTINVEQFGDGRWRFATYTTNKTNQSSSTVVVDEAEKPWNFLAQEVELKECTLSFTTPNLETQLNIEYAKLTKFTTKPSDKTGKFEFKGDLDGAPLELRLNTIRTAPYFEFNGSLALAGFQVAALSTISQDALDQLSGKMKIDGKFHFLQSAEKGLRGSYDGVLALDDTTVATKEIQLGGQAIAYRGLIEFVDGTVREKEVKLEGKLNAKKVNILFEKDVQLSHEQLDVTSKGAVAFGTSPFYVGNSSLVVEDVRYKTKNDLPLLQVGTLSIGGLNTLVGGEIHVQNVQAKELISNIAGSLPLQFKVMEINLEDTKIDDLSKVNVENIDIQNPEMISKERKGEFLRVVQIGLTKLSLNEENEIQADHVFLKKAHLFGGLDSNQNGGGALGQMELTHLKWSPKNGFYGKTLRFDDLFFKVVREEDGKIAIANKFEEMRIPASAERVASYNDPQKNGDQSTYKIDTISMYGNSGIMYKDQTLAVPFQSRLDLESLEIKDLDSSQADASAQINLKGKLEKRAPLVIQGEFIPFSENMGLSLDIELKNYPLKNLSGYAVQSVGTELASGQLQINTELVIAENNINMNNSLLLKRLTTKIISEDLAKELDNQLPISLDSALSVLRDSKGDIDLEIPISGPLEDLDVGIGDVLVTALGKAIVPAASSYFVYALGPYGALAYVGLKAGEKLMQVNLPPLTFAAREQKLTEEHRNYLERVGKILQERPDTDIQICPVVMSWELRPEKELEKIKENNFPLNDGDLPKLQSLGQERGETIKEWLMEVFEISLQRLLICETKVITERDMMPRVDLYL